ncbi:MAG TPA: LysR substrate-binding domain-containing protein [Dermatophilaceae bacterium]|nr:LysR substrate-binding domain-containing protein [Dermatophilaceae bacterium]
METEVLRWFQQVADGATVTEVADICRVSQPQVSRALAALSAEVGAPLLVRSGRVLRLTHAGAIFKRYADRVVAELDDGYAAVAELVDPERGTVTLGFESTLGGWLLPSVIADFRARHPLVRFVLIELDEDQEDGPEVLDTSASARLDLALTTVRPSGVGARWRRLFDEPLFLAVHKGNPLAQRGDVWLSDARGESFVGMPRTSPLGVIGRDLCAAAGFEPEVGFVADDVETVRGFVAAGLGVAILPATGLDPLPEGIGTITLLRLLDPGAHREIGLGWTERRLLPSAELFRRHVLRAARR